MIVFLIIVIVLLIAIFVIALEYRGGYRQGGASRPIPKCKPRPRGQG